ncbi:hypothetical protein ACFWUU_23295 [Kribbella sp. NPDC058693]|uniref:hypothetical protein n=1 Tax=Kribbella sp. NPDC058693 TaxID=3346602 RepID=UPI00365E2873
MTDGMVGDGVLLVVGVLPAPDSLPHPLNTTSPARAATAVYLLRFVTHYGYTSAGRSLQL